MDIGTAMSVAQTLFAALQCTQLKEICSIAGYKSKLDELRATVVRIKAVLEDAEAKQVLSEQERLYIEELKDAVYEADDLFDEFVTLAERKQLTKGIKVRVLSLFTKFGTAYNMAQGVKKIKNKLDAIAYDSRFNLNIDPKPLKERRPETCSYVYEADIIGRDVDLEKIVNILLDTNVEQNVSFLSIVGIGGLGKTALAQLVYNDARVCTAFPLRLWTCVADENQKLLDVEGVLRKILASATGHMMNEGYTMDGLQIQLREKLAGKKFLLVLDDVWTENPNIWHELTQFLMGGQRGSWIVVTTRSQETTRIVGGGVTHELQGLSKEDSWCLFRRVAFRSQHSNPPEDLVEIGQDIVEECADVPLAIRVVGSLLYGQDKQKWLSIQSLGLAKACQKDIMPILKLSYYKLESPLKSCFGYCAIFPKDFRIEKVKLIRLWMAQGYIPLDDPRSPDDLGEEYFSTLLLRCFFQDVQKDDDGNILSCKMHDLMHDVAQQVVGKEICTMESINGNVDSKVRHLSMMYSNYIESANFCFTSKSHMRSYICVNSFVKLLLPMAEKDKLCVDAVASNWKFLRALDLSHLQIKSLPSSIGELIHLRYLDLSHNESLEVPPESITNLGNLQTLNLSWCRKLKELPKDLSKLVKLRVLDLVHSFNLRYMPRGMGKLTCLHTLRIFVVGVTSLRKKEVFDGLGDLKALRNLKGYLIIMIRFTKTSASFYKMNGRREGGCLGNKEHLKRVVLNFGDKFEKERVEYDEAVMEELLPLNSNLKRLEVAGYHGVRMPRWEDNLATFLPNNLVHMGFYDCLKLQNLGQVRLPQLKILHVHSCPNLSVILECPALENLELFDFNERLEIIPISGGGPSSYDKISPNRREAKIDSMAWLKSLPMNPFQDGAKLVICDEKVESLGEAREVFRRCSSSLQYLSIHCSNLKSVVCGGLEHLCALEELEIGHCYNLSQSEEVEREQSFCQSLHSLTLHFLSLVELPNWIQYLTALQTLTIDNCEGVESMPKWMSKLTSLRELHFIRFPERLKERCQDSTGEDWPQIQHIPHIVFKDSDFDD